LTSGTFPVVDQGKELIGGYTDLGNNVINHDGAVIVFGDHTKCFKFINFPFVPGADGTKVLAPQSFLEPKYAYLACTSLRLPDRGYSRHYSFLKKSKFPVAPPLEQRRIVAKVEELFSELDKGVESLTTARGQLKSYRQAVLKYAFEGKLFTHQSGDRRHWPECGVGDAIDFLTSGSRGWADYYATEGETFIRAQNLKHDRLDLTDIAFVKLPSGNSEGVRTRVHVGDVLITITGANVTKTGLVEKDIGTAYVSQHVALCRPNRLIVPEFLYWFLISEAGGRRQLNEAAYGAGKPGLNLDNIREVKIPLPSLDEQRKVVALIRSSISIEETLRADIEEQLTRTLALRHSILKRAFSGQLVAQDPNEEPASALLQRIRAQNEDGGDRRNKNNKNGKKEAA
jgi:type I restriction enzyme S subunit